MKAWATIRKYLPLASIEIPLAILAAGVLLSEASLRRGIGPALFVFAAFNAIFLPSLFWVFLALVRNRGLSCGKIVFLSLIQLSLVLALYFEKYAGVWIVYAFAGLYYLSNAIIFIPSKDFKRIAFFHIIFVLQMILFRVYLSID